MHLIRPSAEHDENGKTIRGDANGLFVWVYLEEIAERK